MNINISHDGPNMSNPTIMENIETMSYRERLRAIFMQDEHIRAIKFHQSRFKYCNSRMLLFYRIMVFIPMAFLSILNTYGYWKMSMYYESEWGFVSSTVSILLIIMA